MGKLVVGWRESSDRLKLKEGSEGVRCSERAGDVICG